MTFSDQDSPLSPEHDGQPGAAPETGAAPRPEPSRPEPSRPEPDAARAQANFLDVTSPPAVAAQSEPEVLPGDPLASVDFGAALRFQPQPVFPEDLRISWSWTHFLVFVFFGAVSIFAVQLGLAFYIAAGRHWSPQEMQRSLEADPSFLVGSNLLWFASLILFLYVTIAVLRGAPFWQSLGWHRLRSLHSPSGAGAAVPVARGQPWMYFAAGCGLSLFVAMAGSQVKEPQHLPIQELFKNRNAALLLMSMAVLIAPIVEETVFRGYLYPLFATKFSSLAARFGYDPQRALHYGTLGGILLTGVLFGLAHGAQLGWTWGLVSLLIFVGIVFTFARAWTGTVLASFLLHLGYNSTIAISTIIVTHGFTRLPPHP